VPIDWKETLSDFLYVKKLNLCISTSITDSKFERKGKVMLLVYYTGY